MLYKGLGQVGLDPRTHSQQSMEEYRRVEKASLWDTLPLALT